MICSQCGNDVAPGSATCTHCGTAAAPGGEAGQPASPSGSYAAGPAGPAAAASPEFAFDAKRLSRDDRVVGGATVLLLISLFLPWYTVSAPSATINGVTVSGVGGFSANAFGGHGWIWVVFILGLAVLAYLVMQAGFETAPVSLPVGPVLLGLTGINLLLVLIAFLVKPGTGDTLVKISIGWGIGAFLGLICAIVAFAPLGLPFARARTGR
jgi:hypothetical protein